MLEITEGVAGLYHYHLRVVGNHYSLCDRMVMRAHTHQKWGFRGHLGERYCMSCAEMAQSFKLGPETYIHGFQKWIEADG